MLPHCQGECKLVEPLWEIVWRYIKKLKICLPLDPTILLLGIHLKESITLIQKKKSTLMFTEVLFTITRILKQPRCPSVDEWIKLWDMYTMEYSLAVKKKIVLLFATVWMDLENIRLNEISESEKDKYHMISLICGI